MLTFRSQPGDTLSAPVGSSGAAFQLTSAAEIGSELAFCELRPHGMRPDLSSGAKALRVHAGGNAAAPLPLPRAARAWEGAPCFVPLAGCPDATRGGAGPRGLPAG